MHILQRKYKNEWDDGLTLKLFIKFLKQHKCVQNLYGYILNHHVIDKDSFFDFDCFAYPICSTIGRMFINYGKNTKAAEKNYGIAIKKDLIISQLWKFYVLERVNKYPEDKRLEIKNSLREQLRNNGTRGSQELEELFEKHKIQLWKFVNAKSSQK